MTQNVTPAAPYNHNAQQIIEVTGAGTVTTPDSVDFVDVVVTGVTVKLPATALPGKLVRVAAPAGGSVTIDGNGHSVRGGATTVSAGTVRGYERSNLGDWVPDASGSGAEPPIGMLQIAIASPQPVSITVTLGDLVNVTHPASKYLGIQFSGGAEDGHTRVILPKPATNDDSYVLSMDLSKMISPPAVSAALEFANDAATGDICSIFGPDPTPHHEAGAVEFVSNVIAEANVTQLRSDVLVTPAGAYLDPGYMVPNGG